jgi:hypothetical protein
MMSFEEKCQKGLRMILKYNKITFELNSLKMMSVPDPGRWDVYAGRTSLENMNCHWWKLRLINQFIYKRYLNKHMRDR